MVLITGLASCKKYLQIDPPANQLVNPLPFDNDATATSTITGIYSEMMRGSQQFCSGYTTLYAGMSADELYYYSPSTRDEFVNNQITISNHTNLTTYFWQPAYKYIYAANLAIEQLEASAALSTSVKSSLTGEAKFIRAFCYFHLVNLFGDVPLVTTSNYKINAGLSRTPASTIYQSIITDLTDAQNTLGTSYLNDEKTRPNKWAAAALLARVYLYTKDWTNAKQQAAAVINSGFYNLASDLNQVFLKNSNEAIWQLQPVNPIYNTWEGNATLPASNSSTPTYLITPALLNAFEANDNRKIAWIGSRRYLNKTVNYPNKYKIYGNRAPLTEYYMVLRLAEQYLIRAEASAKLNDISSALTDINVIRKRAGLSDTTSTSSSEILAITEHERQIELCIEWGHRWFDLNRTDRSNAVLGALKPATWQPTDKLWPIPNDQILLNGSLTQNPGY